MFLNYTEEDILRREPLRPHAANVSIYIRRLSLFTGLRGQAVNWMYHVAITLVVEIVKMKLIHKGT